MYRFWHLDYGEVAYYDQLVFKRHQPIPPEATAGARPASGEASLYCLSVDSLGSN